MNLRYCAQLLIQPAFSSGAPTCSYQNELWTSLSFRSVVSWSSGTRQFWSLYINDDSDRNYSCIVRDRTVLHGTKKPQEAGPGESSAQRHEGIPCDHQPE